MKKIINLLHNISMKNKQKISGFTVLEFLVVLAIIGILIAVALTGIDLSRKKSRDDVRISDVQVIILALEQYREACREYPKSIYDDISPANNGCTPGSGITWDSFMPSGTPKDPDGNEYLYAGMATASPIRCIGYHIGADLEQLENKYLKTDDNFDSTNVMTPKCLPNSPNPEGMGFDGQNSSFPTRYDIVKLR